MYDGKEIRKVIASGGLGRIRKEYKGIFWEVMVMSHIFIGICVPKCMYLSKLSDYSLKNFALFMNFS